MKQFEQHKYLKPLFSESVQRIACHIGVPEKLDTIYEASHSKLRLSHQR